MRVFKVAVFSQWAKKLIPDSALQDVVAELESGLIGDQIGARLYKKRVKIRGRGKSGGARTIIAFKSKHRTFFLFGYERKQSNKRNERLSKEAIKAFQIIGKELLNKSDDEIEQELKKGSIIEILTGGTHEH